MWCQRAMFAALLRPLSVAVALHMHVSRTAVIHDHNFVDVPVTVEEEDMLLSARIFSFRRRFLFSVVSA